MSDEMRWGEPSGQPGSAGVEPHEMAEEKTDKIDHVQTSESREMEELRGADIPWLDQIPQMNRNARQNQAEQMKQEDDAVHGSSFSAEHEHRSDSVNSSRQASERGNESVPPRYAHYEMHQRHQPIDRKPVPKPEKTGGSFFHKLAAVVVLAAVFGLISGLVFQGVNLMTGKYVGTLQNTSVGMTETVPLQEESEQETSSDDVDIKNLVAESGTVAGVAQAAMPSVVAITSISIQEIPSFFSYYGFGYGTQEYSSTGSGSGIIVGENDDELLIATNNHVVEGATSLSVCFIGNDVVGAEEETKSLASGDGDIDVENAVSAKIKGTDPENDLAVVAVQKSDIMAETMNEIKIAQIGSSDNLVVGEQVVAIGNALGYGQSVTSGWVSAMNRTVTMEDGTNADLIQTDAAINPGNSGGALLNMRGELIGINSAKYASNAVEGMGYAIPISKAQPILEELMNRKTREKVDEDKASYLGLIPADLSTEAIEMYNMPSGAFVTEVLPGTAAETAGIQKGDIIVKLDGQKVSGKNDLIEKLTYYEAGEEVEIILARADNGEYVEHTIQAVLGARQDTE